MVSLLPSRNSCKLTMMLFVLFVTLLINQATCLLPPIFQWKIIDFEWKAGAREAALASGNYIPENNMPAGLARWKDKLFITIPRWKKGIPSSLNYVYINGTSDQKLRPYPSCSEECMSGLSCPSNSTVVSTFRVHVDRCDRLWVVDNGVADMSTDVQQISSPAILVFDLNTDDLIMRHELDYNVLKDSSILTSMVVDIPSKGCENSYAYITDMGSNAIIVYSLKEDEAWRVENHYFHFDPHAGEYSVGGIDFYLSDGVSSAALSHMKSDGYRDLYLNPTSSTKQFKMSTKLLRNKDVPKEELFNGVEIVGDRGPKAQATACDFDPRTKVLFFTQLCKNGIGCWSTEKPFSYDNNPLIISDCNVLEFPSDVKVDLEGNLWILSNRQSRFLYGVMDFNQTNFRVLTAPVASIIQGTECEKKSVLAKAFSFISRPKSAGSNKSVCSGK